MTNVTRIAATVRIVSSQVLRNYLPSSIPIECSG
jgi:hypothetical protein